MSKLTLGLSGCHVDKSPCISSWFVVVTVLITLCAMLT